MPECPACGGDRPQPDIPCSSCGAAASGKSDAEGISGKPSESFVVPELDIPRAPPPTGRVSPRAQEPEVSIELAVDANALVRERCPAVPSVGDLVFDAKLLADFGEPAKSWLLWPLYALRVLRRRRELRRALVVRRDEAARTAKEVDDALVAIAEQTRCIVQGVPSFQGVTDDLVHAEELLRSRDQVFAAEQDAQNARLAQFDARLRALEEELARVQGEEREITAELASAQAAVVREEAARKRAVIRSVDAERSGG
jgi:hypothetical protein